MKASTYIKTLSAERAQKGIDSIKARASGMADSANIIALAIVLNPADLAGKAPALLNAVPPNLVRPLGEFFHDYLINSIFVREGSYQLGKARKDITVKVISDDDDVNPSRYQSEATAAAKAARKAKAADTKAAKAAESEAVEKEMEAESLRQVAQVADLQNEVAMLRQALALANARIVELETDNAELVSKLANKGKKTRAA